jgi:hypothetical protein
LAEGAFAAWADEGRNINLGFSPFGHWLHVRIVNAGHDHITQVLELAYEAPDWVDVYLPDGRVVLTGALRERSADQLEHRFIALPVRLAPGVNDMFLRVQSTSALTCHFGFGRRLSFFRICKEPLCCRRFTSGPWWPFLCTTCSWHSH